MRRPHTHCHCVRAFWIHSTPAAHCFLSNMHFCCCWFKLHQHVLFPVAHLTWISACHLKCSLLFYFRVRSVWKPPWGFCFSSCPHRLPFRNFSLIVKWGCYQLKNKVSALTKWWLLWRYNSLLSVIEITNCLELCLQPCHITAVTLFIYLGSFLFLHQANFNFNNFFSSEVL